ncbi:MAG TPA: dihydrolipoamide acetyltransferase family protein, partial [Acidimicrobiales bacterium]
RVGHSSRTTPPASGAAPRNEEGYLSPVVRQLLHDYGLQPDEVVGTGRDGRITRADVVAGAANRAAWAARRPPPPPGPPPFPPHFAPFVAPLGGDVLTARPGVVVPSGVEPGPDDEVIEFTRARRNTAEHMMRSQATSAHTLVVVEVDYAELEPVRKQAKLSYLPFVARAVLMALREYPHLNASVGHDCLVVHKRIHLGIAVDVSFEALVVPVIRDADLLRIHALNGAVADLADRARRKRLGADDLAGGTFSVTNVGQYGTVTTFPVINQPQIAILSTDGVRMRPVAVATADGEWSVTVHPVGNLSLTFDHRAVDGAYASAFLARVRALLEQHDWVTEVLR